ncbi:hypothetical protein [Paraburkholderia sp. DHOC27]|nr:hypothetical protein [Paraburkholderia sp. DHOC27]
MKMAANPEKAATSKTGLLHTKWSGFRRAGSGQLVDRTPISIK